MPVCSALKAPRGSSCLLSLPLAPLVIEGDGAPEAGQALQAEWMVLQEAGGAGRQAGRLEPWPPGPLPLQP